MTDLEMMACYERGVRVRVAGSVDYEFEGRIITIFSKWQPDELRDPLKYRCVIQDDRRFLVIQSAKNLEVAPPV